MSICNAKRNRYILWGAACSGALFALIADVAFDGGTCAIDPKRSVARTREKRWTWLDIGINDFERHQLQTLREKLATRYAVIDTSDGILSERLAGYGGHTPMQLIPLQKS